MKINKKFLIENACSTDGTRYVLTTPYLKDNEMVAIDGRIMAMVTVNGIEI